MLRSMIASGQPRLDAEHRIDSAATIHANLTFPAGLSAWPEGGVVLRLRSPAFPAGKKISRVSVGGAAWPAFNATAETVTIAAAPRSVAALQDVVATFA